MHEHELWFTALLNQYLAGPANAAIEAFGQHAHDHAKPWTNYNAMLVLIVALLLILPWIIRAGLPATKDRGGTDLVTTDPAPTTELSPISTPGRIRLHPPMKQFSPIRVWT